MIGEAAVLAGITTLGFTSIYKKLPRRIRKFLEHHPLFTDIFVLIFMYAFLGFTILAHMAAGLIVLFVTCMLYVANHPDEFGYLTDMKEYLTQKLVELKKALTEYGKNYQASKGVVVPVVD